MKLFMAMVEDNRRQLFHDTVRPLLQVHDELLCEVREDVVEDYSYWAKKAMPKVVDVDLPILAGTASSDRWGTMEK